MDRDAPVNRLKSDSTLRRMKHPQILMLRISQLASMQSLTLSPGGLTQLLKAPPLS